MTRVKMEIRIEIKKYCELFNTFLYLENIHLWRIMPSYCNIVIQMGRGSYLYWG